MTQLRPFYTAQSLWSDFRADSHWTVQVQEAELLGDKEAMVSMEPEKQLLTIEVHYTI